MPKRGLVELQAVSYGSPREGVKARAPLTNRRPTGAETDRAIACRLYRAPPYSCMGARSAPAVLDLGREGAWSARSGYGGELAVGGVLAEFFGILSTSVHFCPIPYLGLRVFSAGSGRISTKNRYELDTFRTRIGHCSFCGGWMLWLVPSSHVNDSTGVLAESSAERCERGGGRSSWGVGCFLIVRPRAPISIFPSWGRGQSSPSSLPSMT